MGHKTVLHAQHHALGARLVDFSGWDMPLHYGSQVEEHHRVRQSAGMFDMSHMTIVDVSGAQARSYLRHLLAADVAGLRQKGQALYSVMLNEKGGVIDDLIVYLMTEPDASGEWYRIVANSSSREKDLRWMADQALRFDVALTEQPELAMIAIQGPKARQRVEQVVSESRARLLSELKEFSGQESEGWFIARIGYTGEDGLEVMLPEEEAVDFWQQLLDAGVTPCGLAARETLRLEAGLSRYGAELDETVSPLAAGMLRGLDLEPKERLFVGREALEAVQAGGVTCRQAGLVMAGEAPLSAGQKVLVDGNAVGEVTSACVSPTLGCVIALARVPVSAADAAEVEVSGKRVQVQVVTPPFVRHGEKVFA
ncbi:glycine cleavage system aminomethyltransferase GcvT [Marinobacterium marinum]|uniref:aminomethyltransferase n=1 Tax=Marinobacterium marinum TaxID=2756129 RepID=A0A7W2ABZ6_9GAMM|nr:glycine cleavage system aminomethyltransferase GcvT [Marinobacterium marinum]MBA4501613.1 glycine cleavage system aminomethyltransferase GcvT [Marinobacterium marinum]